MPFIAGPAPIRPIEMPTVEGSSPTKSGDLDFGKALEHALGDAGAAERNADELGQRFAAGDPNVGIHETMIAAEKAAISVKYAVNLKNKLIEAYRDLLNTPI